MLLTPTTPGFSSIAPNHPHLPSCLSVPLKISESPRYLSLVRSLSPSDSRFPVSPVSSSFAALASLGSPGYTRDKASSREVVLPPLPLPPFSGFPPKLTFAIGMTPDVVLAPSLIFVAARHPSRALPSASLHAIVLKGGYRLLSDVFILAFPRHEAFIGALGIFAASHLGFDNFSSVDSKIYICV